MRQARILLKTPPVLAFRRIRKLEEQLDRVHFKLGAKRNEKLDLKAQLQPTPEARGEHNELGRASIFIEESHVES